MGVSKTTFEEKKQIIVDFLRENKGLSQGELARQLMFDLGYESEMAARVSIGKLLEQLEILGIAFYNEKRPKRGFIPMKVWYLNDGYGIHNVSSERKETERGKISAENNQSI